MTDAPKPGWSRTDCPSCNGHGLKCLYVDAGRDFDGATECSQCDGRGFFFTSPQGRLALWPGGPFVGSIGMQGQIRRVLSFWREKARGVIYRTSVKVILSDGTVYLRREWERKADRYGVSRDSERRAA